ncbi:isoprenylcysteine carboxyl methyltransferase family protein [Streptococcus gallolyticus]|uniref:isoprenylcysteine carboxyl methyltransferase family protein n=1 Tax=Streptococcus hepaticus TaxID=3349163 RepID=UPI001C95A4BB|nr:isoprenylcysteine carboxyl methyltransferase family protein [Streptococcus gallolyticus]MBY5042212.1 isoprenylcysteine carboxyl methyltransferase family protein [Streptococcus gallolyticus]
MIAILVGALFLLRLFFLKISIRNEKQILADGGEEFGVANTKLLTLAHILFYVACLMEASIKQVSFDTVSAFGLILLVFAMVMLYWVVQLLGSIWTVKLMLVKNHRFINHWLFRTIKHPNYFLNILPELIGLALLCHASYSFILLFPLYAFILYKRIKEENKLLKEVIIPNSQQ